MVSIAFLGGGEKLKIEKLDITGIGGIKNLSLKFNPGLNVICGENGVGKTTILNTIADVFSFNKQVIKRNALVKEGSYIAQFSDFTVNEVVKEFNPEEAKDNMKHYKESNYLMNLQINRDIKYSKLSAVPGDMQYRDFQIAEQAVFGISPNEIKGWFVNRCLYSLQELGFTKVMHENLIIAKSAFGILDGNTKFSHIDPHTNDIMLETQKGIVFFEYLSSGYKTCIYIILGILKEIEYRFKEISHENFNGIILIDEVDMHLHPLWQAKLLSVLKTIFKSSQIIVTTHSPSILQSIERDEIIALTSNEEGDTVCRHLNLGEYGLQGWTLEEILKDVMGMPSTTSEMYARTIKAFDQAMMDENIVEIKKNYDELDKMLHPNSTLRKLLQIQMAGMEE